MKNETSFVRQPSVLSSKKSKVEKINKNYRIEL